MADYIVKKHASFVFAFEGDEGKQFSLPSAHSLSFDDTDFLASIKEKDIREQCEGMKEFVLRYNPELKERDIGDMEYIFILRAYLESQGQTLGD